MPLAEIFRLSIFIAAIPLLLAAYRRASKRPVRLSHGGLDLQHESAFIRSVLPFILIIQAISNFILFFLALHYGVARELIVILRTPVAAILTKFREKSGAHAESFRSKVLPGSKFIVFARLFFSNEFSMFILEPTIRDFQDEHHGALQDGRIWKSRLVLIRGYWSFWAAVVAQTPISLMKWITKLSKVG